MPVSDLSYITKTYIELIKREFVNSPAWSGDPPDILPVPPVNLKEGVGFHLYHIIQRKEYDSFPTPAREPETRFLPMALNLYYQLTANSTNEDENGVYNEQLMMSIAMKAIHDCPLIDDTTLVPETPNNPTQILNANIRGNNNRLHISQQPVPYTEAVHNWTAGQVPMKFSVYYEVSTAFLEPDDITSYTGRVLAYGNYVFANGAPRISAIQNTIIFRLPGEATAREVKVQPAQAPPSPPGIQLPESAVSIYGAGFEGGTVSLRLLHPRFKETVITDPTWNITVTAPDRIVVTVREKGVFEKDNNPVDLLPGIYAAQLVVSKTIVLPNGLDTKFKNSSNQFPFTITPRVNDPVRVGITNTFRIAGYLFQFIDAGGNDILEDKIEIYTGEKKLKRHDVAAIGADEFKVVNPSTLEMNISGPLTPGTSIPLRILVDGAETRPLWIII